MATLPGSWHYRVSAGTGRPGVSILWLGEGESWICNFYLSVAARKIVWADPALRYTRICWDVKQPIYKQTDCYWCPTDFNKCTWTPCLKLLWLNVCNNFFFHVRMTPKSWFSHALILFTLLILFTGQLLTDFFCYCPDPYSGAFSTPVDLWDVLLCGVVILDVNSNTLMYFCDDECFYPNYDT